MGKYVDFIVVEPEDRTKLGQVILNRICLARLKAFKQVFIFIAGAETTGTGEGKSYFVLQWIDGLLKSLGIDFAEYLDDIVVYTPMEYGTKVQALLFDPKLKKIPVLMIDEAGDVIDSAKWQTFINRAIRHVNIKSRGIKPLIIFFISPDIRDMDKRSRQMITFYGECMRPLSGSTKVVLERPYKIRQGLEDVFINTRHIAGIVRSKKKNYFLYPKFKIKLPRKEIRDPYEIMQREKKGKLVSEELKNILDELQKSHGKSYTRVDLIIQQFLGKPEMQPLFLKWSTKRKTGEEHLKLDNSFKKSFGLSDNEEKEFVKRFTEKHKEIVKLEKQKEDEFYEESNLPEQPIREEKTI